MIEAYAFLAAFTVQILVTSVLHPAWFIRFVRVLPAERLARLYPGIDVSLVHERLLTQFRATRMGIAVLSLLPLGWIFIDMQRPNWGIGMVVLLIAGVHTLAAYLLPIAFVLWIALKGLKEPKPSLPEVKRTRTAILQRRGLFDFVSPIFVFVAVLGYFLFAAFVVYIQRLSPDFHGLITLGVITLIYALTAFILYITMYGKYRNPFETHVDRLQTMGTTVKGSVYSCIGIVVYLSIIFSLGMLDLTRWVPFATSVFFVICTLLDSIGPAPLRKPEANELGESPAK